MSPQSDPILDELCRRWERAFRALREGDVDVTFPGPVEPDTLAIVAALLVVARKLDALGNAR